MASLLGMPVGGKRKLEQIAVYLQKEKKEALEKWALEEERSVSWLVAKIVDKALQERQPPQDKTAEPLTGTRIDRLKVSKAKI